MGIGLFIALMALLAASALFGARLKSRCFRGMKERYVFKPEPLASGPLVSVIVPARNEAQDIGGLLDSVVAQSYRSIEVIVADDASEDDTLAIAGNFGRRDERVRVVSVGPLPEGWSGKCNACRHAVETARGEFLLFLDCDVRLESPGAVGGMVELALRQDVDLLSLVPRQQLVGLAERLLLPAVYLIMGMKFLPYKAVNDPRHGKAAAVGQCLFFRREAYLAIGGHEPVRGEIAEDMAFARLLKSGGRRLVLLDGARALSVRMYKSLAGLWQGWTKHLYHSATDGFGGFLMREMLLALVFLAPSAVALLSAAMLLKGFGWCAGIALASAVLVEGYGHAVRVKQFRAMDWPVAYAAAFAPAMAFALALLAVSAAKHAIPGGLSWKGRRYTAAKLNA